MGLQQHVTIYSAHPKRACARMMPHVMHVHRCSLSRHAARKVPVFRPFHDSGLNVRIEAL